MTVLKIEKLNKKYDNKQVLFNINIDVEEKDFFAIIGYTGAGKSTLVKCLNLIEDFESGSITYKNKNIDTFNKKEEQSYLQEVSYIFQTPNLLQTKTVFENIKLSLDFSNYQKKDINAKVMKYLDFVGLLEFKNKYPNQLSGGQKQRVAIARSLVLEPKVLICDEITSSLDPKTTHEIIAILKELQKNNQITIIFISHELDLIKTYANKTLILENGKIIANDVTNKIFTNEKIELIQFYNKLLKGDN